VSQSTQYFKYWFRATHRLRRLSRNSRVARCTRFLGGCPRASVSRASFTSASSFLMLCIKQYSEGWLWPICSAKALFQASESLFVRWVFATVASKTFQVCGENDGGWRRRRIHKADGCWADEGHPTERQLPEASCYTVSLFHGRAAASRDRRTTIARLNISRESTAELWSGEYVDECDCQFVPQFQQQMKWNKNLCGRDGRTICGPQCVPKSTCVSL